MPPCPSGRMRSPWRQVRTSIGPRSAAASSVARSGPPGSTGPGCSSARTSQPPTRTRPGRSRASRRAAPRRTRPRESGSGPTRRSRRGRRRDRPCRPRARRPGARSGRRAGGRAPPAGPRRARRARAGPGGAGRAPSRRAPRPGSRRRRRRHRPGRAPRATTRSSSAASSASSARVSATLRSAAGLTSRSTGQHLGADPVAGEGRVDVGLVVGERQPGDRDQLAHPLAIEPEQRPDDPAVARREPEQRPRAGRGGEPVESGLGDVGAGVAGDDRGRAAAPAQALGGVVADARAQRPGGCPAAGRAGRSTCRSMRSAAHSRRAAASPVAGAGAQAVVDVRRRARPRRRASASGPRRRAAESAPPETITTADDPGSISPLAATASASSASAPCSPCVAFTPGWYAREGRIPAPRAARRTSGSSGSRARTTNSSTGWPKPFSSTRRSARTRGRRSSPIASTTLAVTSTSPPSARATTRWVRLTSVPK